MLRLDSVVSEISMLLKRIDEMEVYNKNWWKRLRIFKSRVKCLTEISIADSLSSLQNRNYGK